MKNDSILELQKKLESGEILEKNLSSKQKEQLKELYERQINLLKEMIPVYEKRLECYKNEILKKREILKKKK